MTTTRFNTKSITTISSVVVGSVLKRSFPALKSADETGKRYRRFKRPDQENPPEAPLKISQVPPTIPDHTPEGIKVAEENDYTLFLQEIREEVQELDHFLASCKKALQSLDALQVMSNENVTEAICDIGKIAAVEEAALKLKSVPSSPRRLFDRLYIADEICRNEVVLFGSLAINGRSAWYNWASHLLLVVSQCADLRVRHWPHPNDAPYEIQAKLLVFFEQLPLVAANFTKRESPIYFAVKLQALLNKLVNSFPSGYGDTP